MARFEEVLQEIRIGKKYRLPGWERGQFVAWDDQEGITFYGRGSIDIFHAVNNDDWVSIEEPKKHKVKFWVNVYDKDNGSSLALYKYKKDRDSDYKMDKEWIIACLEFEREFEEGEGLD